MDKEVKRKFAIARCWFMCGLLFFAIVPLITRPEAGLEYYFSGICLGMFICTAIDAIPIVMRWAE